MKRPRRAILGCKIGMSQLYNDKNTIVPVTLIEAGPCTVLQAKEEGTDGYEAFQVGFSDTKKRPGGSWRSSSLSPVANTGWPCS